MNNKIFQNLIFNTGWKTEIDINLFSKKYSITLKFKAYFEKDEVTKEQKLAYSKFEDNKKTILYDIENMLILHSVDAMKRFNPKTLLIDRNGNSALLCDDLDNPDEGIAVCIFPKKCILSQDDYL